MKFNMFLVMCSLCVVFILCSFISGVFTVASGYNNPPIIDPFPGGDQQSVLEGDTLAFEVSAYDPDGDTLELFATGLPPNATFPYLWGEGSVRGPFSFTPDYTQGGHVYSITFVAWDTSGLTTTDTLKVTVIDVPLNVPPTPPDSLRAIGGEIFVTLTWVNPTTDEGGSGLTDLDGIVIYRDGDVIDSVATTGPGTQESYVDSNLVAREYTYWLRAYNDYGLSESSDSLSIEVCGLKCDDNNDWWYDVRDLIHEINIILGTYGPPDSCDVWRADCNGDGVVNIMDVLKKVNIILGIEEPPGGGSVGSLGAGIERRRRD